MAVLGDHQKYSHFAFFGQSEKKKKKKKKKTGWRVSKNPGYLREPKRQCPCTWN